MTKLNSFFPPPTFISLALIFIISCSLFARSCGLPSATAYGGITWTNSLHSLDSWAPPPGYIGEHLTARYILLSNNISYNDMNLQFGCGFFCYGIPCDTGYLFATFFVVYDTDGSLFDLQMVWSANREQLVHENATLTLTSTGNLVLKDADGTLIWSTNTFTQDFHAMRMEESGNLVLLNSSNGTMWQSFDRPTDTVLLGQKWKVGHKLVANISPTNTSQGFFYGSLLLDGMALFTAPAPARMYFRYPRRPTHVNLAYIKMDNETVYYYAETGGSPSPSNPIALSLPIPKNSFFFKIDSDGHAQFYTARSKTGISMTDYLSYFTDALATCAYPRPCGGYGVCTDGQCSCLKTPAGEAFDQIDASKPNFGCVPHRPLICSEVSISSRSPQDHHFLELEHVSYFTYLYENASFPELVSRDYCKNLCFKNCSCKAAFFRYGTNFSRGYCYLESNVYSLKTNNPSDDFYNSTAYIKVQTRPKHSKYSVKIISVTVVGGVVVLFLLLWAWINKSQNAKKEEDEDENDPLDWEAGLPLRYSFRELQNATNDFNIKLGSGGFGSVYEGVLPDSTKIAVKRLDRAGQGTKEFRAEVETLGNIHHLNLVRLKGFCAEKSHRLLVYEYLPNGSLDKWIFPDKSNHEHVLDWNTRSKVVLHIARGLAYLHEECRECIIHFDIKPQNILLDENFNAKVSDFGMAKLINREQSEVITMLRGTPGYMAPELLNMHMTEKADIFSFGVMVVEIVSGKRSRELSGYRLLSVLQCKAEERSLIDLVDPGLQDEGMDAKEEAVKMLGVGMWCIQDDFTRRPAMSIVVKALEGAVDLLDDFPSPFTVSSSQPLLSSDDSNNMELSYMPKSSVLSEPR